MFEALLGTSANVVEAGMGKDICYWEKQPVSAADQGTMAVEGLI